MPGRAAPTITPGSDGSVSVAYSAAEPGIHEVSIVCNEKPAEGVYKSIFQNIPTVILIFSMSSIPVKVFFLIEALQEDILSYCIICNVSTLYEFIVNFYKIGTVYNFPLVFIPILTFAKTFNSDFDIFQVIYNVFPHNKWVSN